MILCIYVKRNPNKWKTSHKIVPPLEGKKTEKYEIKRLKEINMRLNSTFIKEVVIYFFYFVSFHHEHAMF